MLKNQTAFYVIGLSNLKPSDKYALEGEIEIHEDFIIGDFIDSYRNLTMKTLTSYTYFSQYCNSNSTKWIVLNDDDTFINQANLDKALSKLPEHSRYLFTRDNIKT